MNEIETHLLALNGRIVELSNQLETARQAIEVYEFTIKEMEEEIVRWQKLVTKTGMIREFGKLIDDCKEEKSKQPSNAIFFDGQIEGLRKAIGLIKAEVKS